MHHSAVDTLRFVGRAAPAPKNRDRATLFGERCHAYVGRTRKWSGERCRVGRCHRCRPRCRPGWPSCQKRSSPACNKTDQRAGVPQLDNRSLGIATRPVHPRVAAGTTWDIVPGIFNPSTNEVVIAVVGHGTVAGPHIPLSGEGEGSADLVVHETAHGLDMGGGAPFLSASRTFIAARKCD